jgi:hypothetical protein
MCLGSQSASLYKEGLGYTSKKGKATYAPHKTSLKKTMVGFALVVSKLVIKSMIARTRRRMLLYPQLSLILVTFSLRVPMV